MNFDFGHHTFYILLSYGLAASVFAVYLIMRVLKRKRIKKAVRSEFIQHKVNEAQTTNAFLKPNSSTSYDATIEEKK